MEGTVTVFYSCPNFNTSNPSVIDDNQLTRVTVIHSKSEEVCIEPCSKLKSSRFSSGQELNDTGTSTEENKENQDGMSSLASYHRNFSKTTGLFDWLYDLNISSSPPVTSPLQNVTNFVLSISVKIPTRLRLLYLPGHWKPVRIFNGG